MEEELVLPPDSAKCHVSASDVETEKVKDFVFKHFREVSDGSLLSVAEESSMKDYGSPTKRDGQMVNRGRCRAQQGAVFSGKILSFECSVCKDGCTYSPNDLLKHFRAAHRGTLPTYPCDLCGFYTHEFPALQRHRMEHRNTLVTCELCNDGVQYSLLLLTRHYIMNHSVNGQFSCDWCDFNTVDAGTFVQHIHHHNESPWKCPKCRHISLNEEDHQKHLKAHTGTFPYTCQICGYGAARSDYLKNHTAAVHKDLWKPTEDTVAPTNSSSGSKLLLKKSEAQEAPRISKLPSGLMNQNGRLLKPELCLDESPRLVEGIVCKKEIKMWSKVSQTSEQSEVLQECENSAASDPATLTNPNGLTVLMVKNKISLPPNCTTRVMGFKMVEGKKHLVLKVIPTTKQDLSNQNGSLVEDVVSSALNPVKNKVLVENGEGSHIRSSRPHSTATSPRSGSGDQDEIVTVKVKIEEEETSVSSLDSTPHGGDMEQASMALSRSSTSTDSLHPQINELVPSQKSSSETSLINNSLCCDIIRGSPNVRHTLKRCAVRVTDVSAQLNVLKKNVVSKSAREVHRASPDKRSDTLSDTDNRHEDQVSDQDNPDHIRAEGKHRADPPEFKDLSSNSERPIESPPSSSCQHSDTCTLNSPSNQEVFSFHNYSKEAFCSSPNTHQTSNSTSKNSADRHSVHESSHFSVTLSESPELCRSFREDSSVEDDELRTGEDSDREVHKCIVNDPLSEDENPESVLRDFNIIKIEEESVPISKQQVETKSPSEAVEEQPGPIISQQVAKEAVGPSGVAKDALKPTKTTLRILQLGEGQQPVLLRTSDSQFAVPLQVKASPGFKLITNSTNPQINVSYVSPAADRANKPTPNPINRRVAVSAPKTPETGTALLSAVQSGVGTSSNHFFINSPGFKGPVLLSSMPHTTPTDKSAKTPPTCYLLQRSVPLVQTPTAPALRLASTQLPLKSRPVLAMPVNPADKPGALQAGRQAFLLRYISPPKPSTEAKMMTPCSQTNDSSANKVIFKIVTPTGGLLTSAAPPSSSQPLFLAARPQTQCFLVSSNKANANANTPSTVKKLIAVQREVKDTTLPAAQMNVKVPLSDTDKPVLAPRSIRTPSQRKRHRRTLFDEPPETAHKSRRLSHRGVNDKETPEVWRPAAKDHERTLRLCPLSPLQQVKCPRRYQPVVVLNHPDADIPEVSNIMRVVSRHRGAVSKVSLSSHTLQALSELNARQDGPAVNRTSDEDDPLPRPVQSFVQERFILKMKLRRKSRRKFRVVNARSVRLQPAAMFTCWFCGRLFNSQEDWIGHGQRHLMEATRDWNTLS